MNHKRDDRREIDTGDFLWGDEKDGLRIGIRSESVDPEQPSIEIKGAAWNASAEPIELDGSFVLAVRHRDRYAEYGSGPAPSAPVELPPGRFAELRSWRLSDELDTTAPSEVRILFRFGEEIEMSSGVLRLERN